MLSENSAYIILHKVEALPGVQFLIRARDFGTIQMSVRSRPHPTFSGRAMPAEGRIVVRIPEPLEDADLAYMVALITHEVAHVVLPTTPAHGALFRATWCAILSDLLGHDVQWPRAGRRLGLTDAYLHFCEVVQASLDSGDLVL